jgi:hypothetical protein
MNRTFTTLLLAVLFVSGCGEPRPAGMPKLYPASIIVTFEGEPFDGATVQLMPEDAAIARWGPIGQTNSSGVAVLRTDGKYNGAPLGNYKILVSKHSQNHIHIQSGQTYRSLTRIIGGITTSYKTSSRSIVLMQNTRCSRKPHSEWKSPPRARPIRLKSRRNCKKHSHTQNPLGCAALGTDFNDSTTALAYHAITASTGKWSVG